MRIIALFAFMLIYAVGNTQADHKPQFNVMETKAVFHGKTKEVRDLVQREATHPSKRHIWKKNRQVPNFFGRRGESKAILKNMEHQGADKLRQKQIASNKRVPIDPPFVNVNGLTDGSSPNDPSGAIGKDYYVQAINATRIGVYDKEGNLVREFAASLLWESVNGVSLGDPIVLYDEQNQRWIITEFTNPTNFLIAVSETEDPLGAYYAYSFGAPNFPDYPKYAIWGDYLVITTNEQGSGVLHQYFLDREALIAGDSDVTMQRVEVLGQSTEAGFYTSTPVDCNGLLSPQSADPIVLAIADSSWSSDVEEDMLRFISFDVDLSNASLTTVNEVQIPLSPFDGFPCANQNGGQFACIPQPGGTGLDGVPEVVMNAPDYRNFGTHESIVLNFITDVTDGENLSGIRWVELRKEENTDWYVYQEGTFAPDDGLHRYMGSIALDKNGNIGLAYSVSSEDEYVGLRYTGRRNGDELGKMTIEEQVLVTGESTIFSGARYGDYSHMTVDPVNGNAFWFTSEYAGPSDVQTRVAAFEISRDTFDLGISDIISPITGANLTNAEPISVVYRNDGLEPLADYTIGVVYDGDTIETVTIPDTLHSGEAYTHIYDATIDASTFDTYTFTTFINHPLDQSSFNDVREHSFENLPAYEVAISDLQMPSVICEGDSVPLQFQIHNNGFESITNVVVKLTQNDQVVIDNTVDVDIAQNKSIVYTLNSNALEIGETNFVVEVSKPNGFDDNDEVDNQLSNEVSVADNTSMVTLTLKLDSYPEETTWTVIDYTNFNEIVYQGGPYSDGESQLNIPMCLEVDKCYVFTLRDSYEDGLFVDDPAYQIIFNDNVILSGSGDFGSIDAKEFCVSATDCATLTATYTIEDQTSTTLGSVTVEANGGYPPYAYAIDDGEFGDSNTFESLPIGSYEVKVRDSRECEVLETIDIVSPTSDIDNIDKLTVSPNPSESGLFKFEYVNDDLTSYQVSIDILTPNGELVQSAKFNKYDGVYQGTVSLVKYPSGVYFAVVKTLGVRKMVKLTKL